MGAANDVIRLFSASEGTYILPKVIAQQNIAARSEAARCRYVEVASQAGSLPVQAPTRISSASRVPTARRHSRFGIIFGEV
jgi:hypothetical protein